MRGRPVVWVMAFFLSGETPLLKPGRLLPAQVKFAEDDAGVYLNDAALVHRMVQTVMQGNHYDHDLPLGVRLTVQDRLEGVAPDWPESSTALALRELQQAWGGKLPEDSAELFSVLLAMEQGELVKLLAVCVASTVDVVTPRATPHQPDEELAQAVSLDMAAWWHADRRGVFPACAEGRDFASRGRVRAGACHTAGDPARPNGCPRRRSASRSWFQNASWCVSGRFSRENSVMAMRWIVGRA